MFTTEEERKGEPEGGGAALGGVRQAGRARRPCLSMHGNGERPPAATRPALGDARLTTEKSPMKNNSALPCTSGQGNATKPTPDTVPFRHGERKEK